MPRPTVRDVAEVAGVSLATVDRVLNDRNGVRPATRLRVQQAMKKLNFERDVAAANLSRRRDYRFLFILPTGQNTFMRALEEEVLALRPEAERERLALKAMTVPAFDAPALAEALAGLGPGDVDGLAVVATDAPVVRNAIADLRARGVHVVTLISDLPSAPREHFIGIDNVAAGRTAAGLLGRFCAGRQGSIAVIAGSALVRDHIERRLGFDQVMRAEFPGLAVLPSIEGHDDADRVAILLSEMLREHADVVGIYSLGAGNRGIVRALAGAGLPQRPSIVVHELTIHSRQSLQSGLFDAVINQDIGFEVRSAVRALRALVEGGRFDAIRERIRVEIFMRDNLP